ncbi:hypothetical protein RUM44_012440 [Polyplax serrata]|uniref:SET domain-containing protein n=1 Tax=Polyplax serrata TaxID=468196 RepID=A0ABR1BBA5_POLSC
MGDPKIEIRQTGDKGRGLFATGCFSDGEQIFQEIPFVSCQFAWNEDYQYQACEYCLRPLETAVENVKRLTMNEFVELPHPELCTINKSTHISCSLCGAKYCCAECREVAWNKYHKTLCLQKLHRDNTHPLEQLKEVWKEMHYPPETTSAFLFAKIFAMIHQSDDKDAIKNLLNEFCHETMNRDQNITHKLVGFKFAEQVETLRQLMLTSVPTESAQEWATPEGFQHLLALVGTNGQGIGTSSFSEWVKRITAMQLLPEEKAIIDNYIERIYDNFDKGVGDFLNNEGSGLYKMQSIINHSCRPNAVINFPNGNFQLAVTASRNINPGEEICISYLDNCILSRSRHSRQKILQENYLFNCKCDKCEEEINELDETSSDEDEDLSDE